LKRIVFSLVFLSFIYLLTGAQQEEACLRVEASIRPRWLSRGQEGKVIIKIILAKGITINPQPSFVIECTPSQELIFPKNRLH